MSEPTTMDNLIGFVFLLPEGEATVTWDDPVSGVWVPTEPCGNCEDGWVVIGQKAVENAHGEMELEDQEERCSVCGGDGTVIQWPEAALEVAAIWSHNPTSDMSLNRAKDMLDAVAAALKGDGNG